MPSTPEHPRSIRTAWDDAVMIPYVILCLCFITYVPMWDGMEYWRCTVDAAAHPFNPFRYDCTAHPTLGYMLLIGLSQRFVTSYVPVLLANIALGALGLAAFSRILDHLVPGEDWRAERRLATYALSIYPVLTACTLELTPDFGMTVYALCLVLALLERRLGLAVLFGALTSLCKETGIAIFLAIAGAWLVHFVLRADEAEVRLSVRFKRHSALLLVPAIVLFDALGRRVFAHGGAWRGAGSETPLWKQVLSISFLDAILPTQLWEMVGLNFLWVLSLFVVLDALRALWLWASGRATAPPTEPERIGRFITLSFIGALFALTRFRTFVIPRYVLPGVPLLMLLAVRSFWNLKVDARPRRLVLSLVAALFTASNFATLDGVSIKLFDTIPFGSHRLLNLAAHTREPTLTAQLVYNLEFTQIHYLLTQALPVMYAHDWSPVGFPSNAGFGLVDRLNDRRERTAQRAGAHVVTRTLLNREHIPYPQPSTLWFLALPELDEDELILWRLRYTFGAPQTFSRYGYELKVIPMRLRPGFTADSPQITHP